MMFSAAVLAGCSISHSGNPAGTASVSAAASSSAASAAPFATLTAPSLQPPPQHNQNRPDVIFDPCTWIDDAAISSLGYAPDSRKRATDITGEYTFLGCQFQSPDKVYGLSILSGNRTMDEGRAKFTADGAQIQDTTIAGRAAMLIRPTSPATGCDVLLATTAGYVDFDRVIASYLIDGPTPQRCSGMVDLARTVAARIGNN